MDASGKSIRRKFTAEFKADAVALVLDEERTIVDVARSLGIVEQTLGNWVRHLETKSTDPEMSPGNQPQPQDAR